MSKRSRPTSPRRSGIFPMRPNREVQANVTRIDLSRVHARKMIICDDLEDIADDLPARVDRLQCITLGYSLLPLLRECHRFEEDVIFPQYAAATRQSGVVERLKAEHVADDAAAADIAEALIGAVKRTGIDNPEALGYMLRAFFESTRRHIAFERNVVLPALARPSF